MLDVRWPPQSKSMLCVPVSFIATPDFFSHSCIFRNTTFFTLMGLYSGHTTTTTLRVTVLPLSLIVVIRSTILFKENPPFQWMYHVGQSKYS